jgi:hypothetical protein
MDRSPEMLPMTIKPLLLWISLSAFLWWGHQWTPLQAITGGFEQALTQSSVVGETAVYWIQAPIRAYRFITQGTARIATLEQQLAQASVNQASTDRIQREEELQGQLVETPLPEKFLVVEKTQLLSGASGKVVTAGSNKGIEAGMVVVDKNGVLLGLIDEVGMYVSRLRLLTRIQEPVAVRIAGKDITGTVVGDGTVVRLANVAQGLEVMPGDVVVTRGIDNRFPESLVIGRISLIESSPSEVMQTALVELIGIAEGFVTIGR